jgi:hypothetical protein
VALSSFIPGGKRIAGSFGEKPDQVALVLQKTAADRIRRQRDDPASAAHVRTCRDDAAADKGAGDGGDHGGVIGPVPDGVKKIEQFVADES